MPIFLNLSRTWHAYDGLCKYVLQMQPFSDIKLNNVYYSLMDKVTTKIQCSESKHYSTDMHRWLVGYQVLILTMPA